MSLDDEKGGRKDVPLGAVMHFLKRRPHISDERFHEWAERRGYHTPSAEAKAYNLASKASEVMTGGKSKGKATPGVPAEDVRRGIKIEHEHTGNKEVARKIVADHTAEFKNYYNKKKGLPAFEEQLKKAFFEGFFDELEKMAYEGVPFGALYPKKWGSSIPIRKGLAQEFKQLRREQGPAVARARYAGRRAGHAERSWLEGTDTDPADIFFPTREARQRAEHEQWMKELKRKVKS